MLSAVWSTRRRRISALIAAVALIALGLPLVPGIGTAARADASAVTVTGSWHRWLPDTNDPVGYGTSDDNSTPSVTVSQTTDLVDQDVRVSWQGLTPSTNISDYSSLTTPIITDATENGAQLFYGVKIAECGSLVPTYDDQVGLFDDNGNGNCYTNVEGLPDGDHGLNNAVLAATQADGTGSIDFHIEAGGTNPWLGCDSNHPCSLVLVPNNGGEQISGQTPDCSKHDQDFNNDAAGNFLESNTASGLDLGLACSWADRLVVPLHFAPSASTCPSKSPSFQATGSPMLRDAMLQWQAGWCTDKSGPLTFNANSTTDEYQARADFLEGGQQLSAATDVGLVTRPPDAASAAARKFTYAPLSTNAIDIGYHVDNIKTGQPMTDLRLDARLVAKLLTQSYAPQYFGCDPTATPDQPRYYLCANEVAGNPMNIIDDPEFQALNMGPDHPDHPDKSYFDSNGNGSGEGEDLASVVAGNSDLTYEVTRWIASDPDAASFLAGKPDPWGMRINPYYQVANGAPAYPLDQFQELDPGFVWKKGDALAALSFAGIQQDWNPITGLDQVGLRFAANKTSALQASGTCPTDPISQKPADCSPGHTPYNFPAFPGGEQGSRDLWTVVDNSAAAAYTFPAAGLVTPKFASDGSLVSVGQAVTPTTASMSAALADMKTNPDGITQYVDHSVVDANAYPLTVVDYAMVPTCGLTASKAQGITSFLRHVADSQNYGVQPGTLAAGMQALTPGQVAKVQAAAGAVSSQNCTTAPGDPMPRPDTPAPPQSHNAPAPTTGSNSDDQGQSGGTAPDTNPVSSSSAAPASALTPGPSASSSSPARPSSATSVGFKPAGSATSMSWVVPVMLLVGALFLIGAPLTWFLTATSAGRATVTRMRHLR